MPKRVDANKASAKELQSVKGIGPELAKAIDSYRKNYGPFRTIADLKNIAGIGRENLENFIEQGLTVDVQSGQEEMIREIANTISKGIAGIGADPEGMYKAVEHAAAFKPLASRIYSHPYSNIGPGAHAHDMYLANAYMRSVSPAQPLGIIICGLGCYLGCQLTCTTLCKLICAGGCTAGCLAGCVIGCAADGPLPVGDVTASHISLGSATFGADVSGDKAGTASPSVTASAVAAAGSLTTPL